MTYLPSLCGSCRLVFLARAADASGGEVVCSRCGAEARVIPSCSYGAGDVSLFRELSEAVAEGRLAPLEASRLAVEIERALWAKSYGRFFDLLSNRLPGLTPIQLVFGRNPTSQQRAFVMLKTILEALALSARSGTMARVDLSPAAHTKAKSS